MPYQLGKLTIYRLGEEGSGTKLKSGDGYQDFDVILKECLDSGKLFEDPEFPLSDETLKKEEGDLFWERPSGIDTKYYKDGKKPVFSAQEEGDADAFCRFDVKQGGIGNCGSVAAFASSTVHEESRSIVFPDDNSFEEGNYAGVFHFRVYRMGRWLDVVVDDRIPVHKNFCPHSVKPIGCKDVREYWPCLLEKVRAKLGQSYEGNKTGGGTKGLELFTGGCFEHIDSTLPGAFERIQKLWDEGAVGEVSSFGKSEDGMVRGHGYSVTGFALVKTKDGAEVELIRLRNPWGYKEFNGPWSDGSKEWDQVSDEEKKKLELVKRDDGEFWMALKDFPQYSGGQVNVKIVSLLSQELNQNKESSWNYIKHTGEWTEDHVLEKCGPASQFSFNIERNKPTWTVFSLSTLNSVLGGDEDNTRKVGYRVYKLEDTDTKLPLSWKLLGKRKEIGRTYGNLGTSLDPKSWQLEAGTYCVYVYVQTLPDKGSNYDEFALRILHEK